MIRRAAVALGLGALAFFASAPGAGAHALLRSSDPTEGATLAMSPGEIRINFTETPEASLSSIRVLDPTGVSHEAGRPRPTGDDGLSVGVRALPKGVYTVAWRVVSRVDGHATAGAFAFGIGVAPTAIGEAPESKSPSASPLEMTGRWTFFVGLVALLGVTWTSLFLTSGARPSPLAGAGWLVAAAGLALLAEAQRRAASVQIGDLLATSLGRALVWRLVALMGAGVALLVARSAAPRVRTAALAAAAAAASAAMLAHVAAGHAAAGGSGRWAAVAAQWVHFSAVGTWIGGLAALLLLLRGDPSAQKSSAARRFSSVAGWSLGLVAVTGVVRAWDEVGGFGALTSTGYGRSVLTKSGLLVAIAALGAVNRYRHVPAAGVTLIGLRRVARGELGLAAVALGAAAVLASLAPPAPARAAPRVSVTGSDFATTVRVRLEALPGLAGSNSFRVRIADFDTDEDVRADRVSLRFAFLEDPSIGQSSLELARAGDGTYRGTGTNASLAGRWRVTVLIETGADSVEIPLEVRIGAAVQPTRVDRIPGQPTLSTVSLAGGGSVQVYADPERAGPTEIHVTFFDASGGERPVSSLVLRAASAGAPPTRPKVRRFSPGHFVADHRLPAGRTRLTIDATARDGALLHAEVVLEVPE